MRSPHEILNLPYDASPEDIRRACQSWAKLVHPDRVETDLKEFATTRMQEINGAYQALTSGQKRKDAAGQNGVEEYLSFLRENSEVRQSKGNGQLTLPHWPLPATALTFESDDSGPFLNLYIKHDKNGNFTITDRRRISPRPYCPTHSAGSWMPPVDCQTVQYTEEPANCPPSEPP